MDRSCTEVDVLDAQAKALHQAKIGTIHQAHHEPHVRPHMAQDGSNLLSRQDDRKPLRPLRADDGAQVSQLSVEYVQVEKEKGAQRLILRGCCNSPIDGEVREECVDLGLSHLGRVAHSVEADESASPHSVRLFRPLAVMPRAKFRP